MLVVWIMLENNMVDMADVEMVIDFMVEMTGLFFRYLAKFVEGLL